MCKPLDPDEPSEASARDLADALVAASGARAKDRITIVGSGQIELLVALVRRGFANVACRAAGTALPPARGEADILLAPTVEGEADLRCIVRQFGASLAAHGALVIRANDSAGLGGRRVRQIFLNAGFDAVERLPGGRFWCARKQAASLASAA